MLGAAAVSPLPGDGVGGSEGRGSRQPPPRWGAGRPRERSRGRGELAAGQVLSCGENNINWLQLNKQGSIR